MAAGFPKGSPSQLSGDPDILQRGVFSGILGPDNLDGPAHTHVQLVVLGPIVLPRSDAFNLLARLEASFSFLSSSLIKYSDVNLIVWMPI